MRKGKIIVLSAPSGSGKSTIINRLMDNPSLNLRFSISATSRQPRGNENNGKEYYFLTQDEFKEKVDKDEFVEWEEVYAGTCYGTLKSEVTRITESEYSNLIMDIDVKGALNVKQKFGESALTIFIMPPSIEALEKRLRNRSTDTEESINKRLSKAEYEMQFSQEFDIIIVNDNLDEAVNSVTKAIKNYIECN